MCTVSNPSQCLYQETALEDGGLPFKEQENL